MIKTKVKLKELVFIIISLMILVFCVTKILRGADTDSESSGGVWNYISLLFYPLALVPLFTRKHHINVTFISLGVYLLIAGLVAGFYFWDSPITTASVYNLIMVPFFAMVFTAMYFYAEKVRSAEIILIITFFACFLLNSISILRYQFGGSARALASDIYYSLGMFPFFLLFSKNRMMRYVVTILLFSISFLSGKRAGFIGLSVAIVVFLLVDASIRANNMVRVIRMIILIGLAVLAVYLISRYLDNILHTGLYERLERLDEDGGGGREKIYRRMWDGFVNSSFIQQLFGHGVYASSSIVGILAHNDFLEILYDYGVFALIAIIIFMVSLYVEAYKMVRRKSPYAPAYLASLIIGTFLCMFSYMLTFYTYVLCYVSMWGYSISMERKRLQESEGTGIQT